jgi:two-component system, chemotaxis family, protein-glutamate methylesterase/glutaminase
MSRRDIIGIGASLGGVAATKQLLGGLPPDFAATIFVVIHVGAEGKNLLADIFNAQSALSASIAEDGEPVSAGHVYVAPADHHLLVIDNIIRLGRGPRENMARPAIDPLFRSLGLTYGPRAIGIVLTGMLNDGAAGLADLKRCGGLTVVQNPSDAVAPDMPLGALFASDIDYRAPLTDLSKLLQELCKQEVGAPIEAPDDIRTEVGIALGRRADAQITATIADLVPLTCPDCGGNLSQIKRPPLRFRCQVGHAYTAEVLAAKTEGGLDDAIRVALRIVLERAVLTERMADDARRSGRPAAASSYEERAIQCRAYVDVLQQALQPG